MLRPNLTSRWLPLALALLGVALITTLALWPARAGVYVPWGVGVGAALVVASALWLVWGGRPRDALLDRLRRSAAAQRIAMRHEQAQWQVARAELEATLREREAELHRREQGLASRLVTFHEWMEFPQPFTVERSPAAEKAEGELAQRDRQLLKLLQAETERLFQDIRANKYMREGKFQPLMLRDEGWDLARRVARLYWPESENPLLETSPDLILRGTSRISLQLQVLLDELPLNVKTQNLNSLYQYVRQAVKAYDVYRSVEPYWPYVNTAYYLSRVALGANPASLGAWWFLSALGKKGAEKVSQHLLHRHALTLLQSVVRVIGFEVAALYGGDFRHRDANWIYGAELNELVRSFPVSRDSLSHALKEVGALQLRSEYDRVFLYRCLAAHTTAQPERYAAATVLTMEERQAIALRLERFLEAFIHGRTQSRMKQWKEAVENRLQVKLVTPLAAVSKSEAFQRRESLRSLASFLLGIKEQEPEDLDEWLKLTDLWNELSSQERQEQLEALRESPPFFFEHPDLDLDSPFVERYLEDLARLAAHTRPRLESTDELLADTAIYLRREAKEMRQRLRRQYQAVLDRYWAHPGLKRQLPAPVSRAILDLLEEGERLRFVFEEAGPEWPSGPAGGERDSWLVGCSARMLLLRVKGIEIVSVEWEAEYGVVPERVRGYLSQDCRLRGGQWRNPAWAGAQVRISGAKLSRYESYFQPLLVWCELRASAPSS